MLKIDRQKLIEEELNLNGSVLISNLSASFGCSEETIRRDLKELEQQNKLIRVHGGAYLPDDQEPGIPSKIKVTLLKEEKINMGTAACNFFINDHDTIMLDSSTTCLILAKEILAQDLKVTIITNSLAIMTLFDVKRCKAKLISVGGKYIPHNNSFNGFETVNSIGAYLADTSFISPTCLHQKFGLLDNSQKEANVRKAFLTHSRIRYIVADHTKLYDKADNIIGNLDLVDCLITDKPVSNSWKAIFDKYKIRVIVS